ncbi:MAG TPA: 50S ribosomal protein L15 [Candidatus Omnitrophica bacterium]|nr:MAG: 50S ribosomal protein L15 [Omnitrophica WOR_2 bacterium GWA2_45_18]OGX19671.1 MAG: 50S ribosomal protein L15 [Omnitrophica WOR_2 bacterium GWC2_45_7]HBR14654.1 50S ribosomal protein L15 [Candidatus Omnitrophota bacterium]
MQLHELISPKGSRKRRKIVGRGRGSGHGKTSCRGQKGQKSRSGRGILRGLEGGQMPLIRRLPKVGFRSKRPILNQIVKLGDLNRFESGTVINAEFLKTEGLIKSLNKPFKILGDGEIKKSLIIQAESLSKTAREKITKAGGKITNFDKTSGEEKPAAKK